MAQQIIDNGDAALVAREKINDNFEELYAGGGIGGVGIASQPEVDAETNNTKAVSPLTLAKKALKAGSYSAALSFASNEDVYKDATGLSLSFTLGAGNINGCFKILRIDSPTSVAFDSNFLPSADSSPFSSTQINLCILTYYADYDGIGTERVVYQNINSLQPSMRSGVYNFELTFDNDEELYQDTTGLNPVFTLASSDNVNGVIKFMRFNKPASITFTGRFTADPSHTAFNAANLNVCLLFYIEDWGDGSPMVVYSNKLFTAL